MFRCLRGEEITALILEKQACKQIKMCKYFELFKILIIIII